MNKRTIIAISATTAAATLGIAGTVASASEDYDRERPITGAALTAASAAALAYTGEGRVTDAKIGDEDSLYELEVSLDDGRQVDVQLDRDFHIVGSAADVEVEAGDE